MEGHDLAPCQVGSSLAAAAQGAAGCLSCEGTLLPHHQLSPHQSPNAISGSCFSFSPRLSGCVGLFRSMALWLLLLTSRDRSLSAQFSITLPCCSPAMATPPHVCRGHQACGSFLSLSVVKSRVSNNWYRSLRDVAGGQPLLDLVLLVAMLPAQQSLTGSGCWWQRVVILISIYII